MVAVLPRESVTETRHSFNPGVVSMDVVAVVDVDVPVELIPGPLNAMDAIDA